MLSDLHDRIRAIGIVGYSLCWLIFSIGLLNMASTALSSVVLRQKEFTVLETVGMTKFGLMCLLVTENAVILSASALPSCVMSCPVIEIFLSHGFGCSVRVPVWAAAGMTGIVFVIAVGVSMVVWRQIGKTSLSERCRL